MSVNCEFETYGVLYFGHMSIKCKIKLIQSLADLLFDPEH